jgi:serine kinase of HPr protein (carbohydrate metabolism regulator)
VSKPVPPATGPAATSLADAGEVHASCALVGERAVLIRGASGAGKSTLARGLVAGAAAAGLFARLVADDRVLLRRSHGRLIAAPHPLIAGLVEIRGAGPQPRAFEPAARIGLVIDLDPAPERVPEEEARFCQLMGVALPRIVLPERPVEPDLVTIVAGLYDRDVDNPSQGLALHIAMHKMRPPG